MILDTSIYNMLLYRFDSVDELCEATLKSMNNITGSWKFRREKGITQWDWVGRSVYNTRHAIELARQDWPEGIRMFEGLMEQARHFDIPRPASIRRTAKWSEDHGDDFDLDRYRNGQEYWRTTERSFRPGPTIKTIIVNNGMLANVNTIAVTWRGVAATVLTELLEGAGYRVELYSARQAEGSYTDGKDHGSLVNLKRSSDPLDRSTLLNSLSGWFFRTLYLSAVSLRESYLDPKGRCGATTYINWSRHIVGDDKAAILDKWVIDSLTALQWIKNTLGELTNPPPPPPPPIEAPASAAPVAPPKTYTKTELNKMLKDWERAKKARIKNNEEGA